MLTVFRRIRKGLLDMGAARKYLLYAVGEIALVVIGILIALQINNWNEEKKQTQTIKNYLENLMGDLQNDEINFREIIEESSFRYYSLQYLLRLVGELPYDPMPDGHVVREWKGNKIWKDPIPDDYDEEFIKLAFLWTHRTGRHKVNSSTVEELKSTGAYSKLNEDLKDSVNAYHDDWDFRFGPLAFQRTQETISQWQNELIHNGIINSNPYINGDPIVLLDKSLTLKARIRNMAAHASWNAMSSKIICEKAIGLKRIIENELTEM